MHEFATIEIPKWNAVTTRSVLVFVPHEASDNSTGATHPTTMWKRISKGLGSMPVFALEKPKQSDSHPFSWVQLHDATRPEDDEAVTTMISLSRWVFLLRTIIVESLQRSLIAVKFD